MSSLGPKASAASLYPILMGSRFPVTAVANRALLPSRTVGEQRIIGGRTFDFARQVAVMAIVNRTPDSFHDRGRTFALERAVEAVTAAADAGADWIDIGGVPFAPGPEVTAAEELDRVLPVVEAARTRTV